MHPDLGQNRHIRELAVSKAVISTYSLYVGFASSSRGPRSRVRSSATGRARHRAGRVTFDLPGYRVIDAVDRPGLSLPVIIASTAMEAACRSCGVLSSRVHQRVRQRLADVPIAGRVEVVLVRRRFSCAEQLCERRTFVEVSDQVPLRARMTTRLRAVVLEAVVTAGRVVAEVA